MNAKISSTSSGARPSDGSSSMSRRGPRHERPADGEHLLLAAGEVAGDAGRAGPPSLGRSRVDPVEVPALDRPAAEVGAGDEVLLDGQVLEDVPALHAQRDAAA